jgi:hypothetical protein
VTVGRVGGAARRFLISIVFTDDCELTIFCIRFYIWRTLELC